MVTVSPREEETVLVCRGKYAGEVFIRKNHGLGRQLLYTIYNAWYCLFLYKTEDFLKSKVRIEQKHHLSNKQKLSGIIEVL